MSNRATSGIEMQRVKYKKLLLVINCFYFGFGLMFIAGYIISIIMLLDIIANTLIIIPMLIGYFGGVMLIIPFTIRLAKNYDIEKYKTHKKHFKSNKNLCKYNEEDNRDKKNKYFEIEYKKKRFFAIVGFLYSIYFALGAAFSALAGVPQWLAFIVLPAIGVGLVHIFGGYWAMAYKELKQFRLADCKHEEATKE